MRMMKSTKYKETEIGEIPEEWSILKLSDLTFKITKGTTPTTLGGKFVNKGINFVKVESLNDDGTINQEKFMYIDEETNNLLARSKLQRNDLLYSIAGTIGRVSIVSDDILPANVNQAVAILRPNLSKINLLYLRYALVNPELKNYLLSKVVHAVQANLSLSEIGNCPVPIPDTKEQEKIAKILSDLDSKIKLNQQMKKSLESIGQSLFKYWFVDFEFPNEKTKPYKLSGGEMVDSELGEIPKGWKIKPIDEIAKFLNGLALQKFPAEEGEEYLPVIKIRELRQGITESTDKANLSLPSEYIINDGDILFSWSGSLEVVIWTSGRGALNQHLFKVSSDTYPKWFYYDWVLHYLPEYRLIAEGKATTMGHIQRQHLKNSLVVIPSEGTLTKMNNVLNPIIEKLIEININSRNLSQIRELLLPKLMSGKIRVPVEVRT